MQLLITVHFIESLYLLLYIPMLSLYTIQRLFIEKNIQQLI